MRGVVFCAWAINCRWKGRLRMRCHLMEQCSDTAGLGGGAEAGLHALSVVVQALHSWGGEPKPKGGGD